MSLITRMKHYIETLKKYGPVIVAESKKKRTNKNG